MNQPAKPIRPSLLRVRGQGLLRITREFVLENLAAVYYGINGFDNTLQIIEHLADKNGWQITYRTLQGECLIDVMNCFPEVDLWVCKRIDLDAVERAYGQNNYSPADRVGNP